LIAFVQAKEHFARNLADEQSLRMPAEVNDLFKSILVDNFQAATNAFAQLQIESGRAATPTAPSQARAVFNKLQTLGERIGLPPPKTSALECSPWHAIVDAHWAYVLSKTWRRPVLEMAVKAIIDAVPAESIFFGDSDLGRFAASVALTSLPEGRRFLVLTQNQLVDSTYLDFLNSLYGRGMVLPKPRDYQPIYGDYNDGKYGRGDAATLAVNGLLSKWISDANLNRPIYIEAS